MRYGILPFAFFVLLPLQIEQRVNSRAIGLSAEHPLSVQVYDILDEIGDTIQDPTTVVASQLDKKNPPRPMDDSDRITCMTCGAPGIHGDCGNGPPVIVD